jgi:hypothetical protein
VVFSNPNIEDAIISSVSSDGNYTLTFEVDDNAGNSGPLDPLLFQDTMTLTVDRVPPGAPTVSGSTPTLDTTPTWTWTQPAGATYYRYSLDGARYYGTSNLSYTPKGALAYGDHTLDVQARDAAGNYSTTGSKGVHIYPSIYPPYGSANVSRAAYLQWDDVPGAYYYDVYFGVGSPAAMAKIVTLPATATSFKPYFFHPLTMHFWGIVARPQKGDAIYTSPMLPASPFFFMTGY